ncbi:MAG: TetR/AcrR family transcriptional regulator C-terminal domain-containing protein, partial [Actinobacteria bacterium]|nr:TetR/AcrR family transcriptional regulator C-terminal domain-containing protein [Actinomycetota bacterium]
MKRTRVKSHPPLTRERALQAATELADAGGLEAVTMRRLAQEIGVEAMSLYYHFANKDAVLDGMADLVFGEILLPPIESPDWRISMRERALSMRNVILSHPWAMAIMESRTSPGPATLGHHNAVIGCLRHSGFTIPMAAHAFSVMDAYIFGFVLSEVNLPFDESTTPTEMEQLVEGMIANFPADDFPHLMEMTAEHILTPDYSYA